MLRPREEGIHGSREHRETKEWARSSQMENLEVPARCGSILQHGGRISNPHRVLIGAGARLGRKLYQMKVNQEWLS